jgi:hypothetical protein
VRTKEDGAKLNEAKTTMAERGTPLADRLVQMLLDRRQRVAAEAYLAPALTRARSGPPGARTQNLRIKSPQLYQLS